jgi:hypothetical protein
MKDNDKNTCWRDYWIIILQKNIWVMNYSLVWYNTKIIRIIHITVYPTHTADNTNLAYMFSENICES